MDAETHRYGKLEWVFYILILPLLFTALLSGIVLQFFGYDVTGKIASYAREIPVVGSLLPEGEKVEESPEDKLEAAQNKVTALESSKKQLQGDLDKKDKENESLKKKIEDLQKQAKKLKEDQANKDANADGAASANNTPSDTASAKPESAQPKDPIQTQADVYAEISPAQAAKILTELSVTEVKRILDKMTVEQQAAILGKMDAVVAGKILSP